MSSEARDKMIERLFYKMFPMLIKHFRLRTDCAAVHGTLVFNNGKLSNGQDIARNAKILALKYQKRLQEMEQEDPGFARSVMT